MTDEEYIITEPVAPSNLVDRIAEPILSLVALAVLYFFGLDWFLNPVTSFVSQFEWFSAVVAIGDYLSSVLEWLDSLNPTPGDSSNAEVG